MGPGAEQPGQPPGQPPPDLPPDRSVLIRVPRPFSLGRTLRRSLILPRDPCMRAEGPAVYLGMNTPEGPAEVRYLPLFEEEPSEEPEGAAGPGGLEVRVEAWGEGAAWATAQAPRLLGVEDDPEAFAPEHPALKPLARRFRGTRFGRSERLLDRIVPVILGQRVRTADARDSYARLVHLYGRRGPGPGKVWCPPPAEALRGISFARFASFGVEQKRAGPILLVARRARALERLALASPEEAYAALLAHPGIGPWTAAHVTSWVHGDADAVPTGDFHLPNSVAFTLAGEVRATDERMLELLEPFRPHRGRALQLIKHGGRGAPRFGPRRPRSPGI